MSTYRIQKDKENPYVMLNKEFLNDSSLSWQAKGMLSYLLSLPDDWKIYETEIQTHSSDGIKCTRSSIKELINNGYIQRERLQDLKGRFAGYEYCVREVSSIMPKTENGKRHTTNNNKTNNDNIPQIGLHRSGNKFYFNGKKINKLEYQMRCTEDLNNVMNR